MTKINEQGTTREKSAIKGLGGQDNSNKEKTMNTVKKLPMPESYTNKQGSTNSDMPMRAPEDSKDRDFATEEFTTDNKNPNNESYAKTKQPKGAAGKGMGLGVIGKLANSDKWGNTGNS